MKFSAIAFRFVLERVAALAAPGQKADQLKKTAYPTSGRKETTSETPSERFDDGVA